ncbi:MAG: hypothetical protein AAGF79_17620 [Pseudomonadota bacterium]
MPDDARAFGIAFQSDNLLFVAQRVVDDGFLSQTLVIGTDGFDFEFGKSRTDEVVRRELIVEGRVVDFSETWERDRLGGGRDQDGSVFVEDYSLLDLF